MATADRPSWIVVGRHGGDVGVAMLDADGTTLERSILPPAHVSSWVRESEAAWHPRWVWSDTPTWYGPLIADGIRVDRCYDVRLSRAILRHSDLVSDAEIREPSAWDSAPVDTDDTPALFDLAEAGNARPALPTALDDAVAEFLRQRAAVATASDPARLRLLTAAESAGALIAVEMRAAGLPWDAVEHDRILTRVLGARSPGGGAPALVEDAARRVRAALGDPRASLDSHPKLLRSLHRAGVPVASTSRWELAEHDHPVIEPLLEYKKLARLLSANGWGWLAEWVHDGRFRPVYVPGGVVTGRWASSGGGALQLPRQLRAAVRADPGWKLIVADVAQLEPRVLAAMSRDTALAAAARGRDLYEGIVGSGVVSSRADAKIAVLGAMYGATTGESGRLVPRLRKAYPRAMALVDAAAATGEHGGVVTTWLGRSSPEPSAHWTEAQSRASEITASGGEETHARRAARDRGRFTRNFIVQGTAAEWALSWLADLRRRLAAMPETSDAAAPRSGPAFARNPHLAFFLHDEVIVHAPEAMAEDVALAVRESAAAAGRLLFGAFPLDFPLDLRIADSADEP